MGGGGGRFFSSGAGGCILENYKVCRRLHRRREGGWRDHLAAFMGLWRVVGCRRLRKEEGGWMVRPPGGYFVMEGF